MSDGYAVGCTDGVKEGVVDGFNVGCSVGLVVGMRVGCLDGFLVGNRVLIVACSICSVSVVGTRVIMPHDPDLVGFGVGLFRSASS